MYELKLLNSDFAEILHSQFLEEKAIVMSIQVPTP
jgi:hypothetical protein